MKSLLVGAASAAALIFTLGAGGMPTGENGRYHIAVDTNGHAVMVDSATGQAWTTVLQNAQNTPDNFYVVKTK